MRRNKKRRENNFPYNNFEVCIGIILLIFSFIIISFILNRFITRNQYSNFIDMIAEKNTNVPFSLDKILLYSSAHANTQTSSSNWLLDISQYTDIAIYLDNQSENGLFDTNTIKELSIDSFSFTEKPTIGTPKLFYKNLNQFGRLETLSEHSLTDSFSYTVIQDKVELDYTNYEISSACNVPIVLTYVNQNLKTDYTLPSNTNLSFNGMLLKQANIPLNNLSCQFSFVIHLTANNNELYRCQISIPIPLKTEKDSIYNGDIKLEINNLQNYKFYKL